MPPISADVSDRLVILSDLHLGRSRCAARSADALRPLWNGADRLILNGDIAELHHPQHRKRAVQETLKLNELCERDGVEVTMLSGNHDPFISDLRHLELADGSVFVTHGDVMHPAIAPWSPCAKNIRRAHDMAMEILGDEPVDSLEARLMASQHASHTEWENMEHQASRSSLTRMLLRPWVFFTVLHYWAIVPGLANAFVEEHAPEARYVIFGHTHFPGVWHINGRVIINTGSFGFPGRPRGVVLAEGTLEVQVIKQRGDQYIFGVHPLATYPLTDVEDSPVISPPGVIIEPSALNTRPVSSLPKTAVM